ncbi:MAG: hypothetical protein U0797_04610 [Gemmataceae bacterium]
MPRQAQEARLVELVRCWQHWTAVVELFARRRPARHRVDPEEYGRLYQDLLEACRDMAARGERRPLCEKLEALVQPWLTPKALGQADAELLQDLLRRCRQAEEELLGGTRPPGREWVAVTLCVFAGAALVIWAPVWYWPSLLGQARGWLYGSLWAVRHTSPTQVMLAVGVLLIVAGILLVLRTYQRG